MHAYCSTRYTHQNTQSTSLVNDVAPSSEFCFYQTMEFESKVQGMDWQSLRVFEFSAITWLEWIHNDILEGAHCRCISVVHHCWRWIHLGIKHIQTIFQGLDHRLCPGSGNSFAKLYFVEYITRRKVTQRTKHIQSNQRMTHVPANRGASMTMAPIAE